MKRISESLQSRYLVEEISAGEGLSECQWGGRFVEEQADSWQEVTTLNHFISTSHYTPNLPPAPLPLLFYPLPLNFPFSPFPAAFSSSSSLFSSLPRLLHCLSGLCWKRKVRVALYSALHNKNVFGAWLLAKWFYLPKIILCPFIGAFMTHFWDSNWPYSCQSGAVRAILDTSRVWLVVHFIDCLS